MKTIRKAAVTLVATTFVGASLVPAMAQSTATETQPVAEERVAHASSRSGPRRGGGERGMRRAFERYDVNNDGVITQDEVEAVIEERFNRFAGENGVITLDDFRTAWLQSTRMPMVRAFQRLDRDGDGAVTVAEFDSASERMFNRLDRDGNGELTRPQRREATRAGQGQGRMATRSWRRGGRGTERLMERFDTDGDGKITRAEFDQIRTALFGDADSDNNQSVSLEEFAAIWQDMNQERIVSGFQSYDRNGDLSITREEYSAGNIDFVRNNDRNMDGVVTSADRKRAKHRGERSQRMKQREGKRAQSRDQVRPVQPIQPDTQG
ncbi:MAG: EF-hand domain-containing protein [Pseudomonadota bacterium]